MKNETELVLLRRELDFIVSQKVEIIKELAKQNQLILRIVNEYKEKREALLKDKLKECGMTWCTFCDGVVAEREATLLFIEQKHHFIMGNPLLRNNCFSRVHRVCPQCSSYMLNQQQYPQSLNDRSYEIGKVECRKDGYYVYRSCEWFKFNGDFSDLDKPTNRFIEIHAKKIGIPPRIYVATSINNNCFKVVICDDVVSQV